MGNHRFEINKEKNRLFIELSGFFREAEARQVWVDLEQIVSDLRPGFDVITDLTNFKPGLPAVARNLRKAAEIIKAKGRRRAVRVAGKFITGMMQYKRELQGVFDEDTTRYANSIAEAEKILDEWD